MPGTWRVRGGRGRPLATAGELAGATIHHAAWRRTDSAEFSDLKALYGHNRQDYENRQKDELSYQKRRLFPSGRQGMQCRGLS